MFSDFRTGDQQESQFMPDLRATELRKNFYYSTYYNLLARLLLLGIIPLSLLAYFNYKIYQGMRLPSFLSEQESIKEKRRMQESELAIVLIGIVVVFMLGHVLRIFLNVYEMVMIPSEGSKPCHPTWTEVAKAFNALLLAFSSSSNMIIYCCLNSTFRKYLKQYFQNILRKIACKAATNPDRESYQNIRGRQTLQCTE